MKEAVWEEVKVILKKLCPNSILHKGLSIHGSHVDGCRQQLERGLGGK